MGLNCKPGELCVIFGARLTPEANGHFVTTVRLIEVGERYEGGFLASNTTGGPVWLVRGHNIPVRSVSGVLHFGKERGVGDKRLRPIRPGDLTQEEVDALYLPEVIKQRDPEAA